MSVRTSFIPAPLSFRGDASMHIDAPENANYAAVVVKIATIVPLAGSDFIVGTPLLGYQAIVGKATTNVGDLGIVFPPECQLSENYCYENNLYRHQNLNRDPLGKGYLEDNRRVRAMKFRGHRSDCLFMPLSSLAYTGADLSKLKVGDIFDTLNGQTICRKYVIPVRGGFTPRVEKNKVARIESKFLPEHFDSDNFFRNRHAIDSATRVVVTQKLHGTSVRIGHTVVKRPLSRFERVLRRFGVRIVETEYDYVFGSRKVIKDANDPNQAHYYDTDIWTLTGKTVEGILPQGYLVYGEIVGWTPFGSPIQSNYTYDLPEGASRLYVYRIATINPQGRVTDLSWDQVEEFCRDTGLTHVPELWSGQMKDFVVEDYLDKRFFDEGRGYEMPVPLSDKDTVDEGVCIRVDGLAPYILKAKSPIFLGFETKMLDDEVVDLETEGGVAVPG